MSEKIKSIEIKYIKKYHSVLESHQIICLYPLVKMYFHINYDLTCAIANFINQYSDLSIFKIFKAEQQQKGDTSQPQTEQQVQQDKDDITWDHFKFTIKDKEGKEEKEIKLISTMVDKLEKLQENMQGFKEQLFIQFSIWNEDQIYAYLSKCIKVINYIEQKQKTIMDGNSDTQNLEEEIVEQLKNEKE
ncbi:unnamed protein product [Paramecium octaurelia]|uniref:Uncharacterized protein n=1 Tax=Paramecium octaurelia TaxID=43137 RepID=A0A8S1YD02_PAROT|nr:unnamed protein product [Paramecium octaurelia]